ncbi:MAG: M50 family metallopeptidase [Parcubacteria group bacterium]
MEFILTALLIIVFFAILILGHEVGHFTAAKLLKLEVQEFGFGLPPKLIGKKWRGTEYSLNAIPFGGFVKVDAIEISSEKYMDVPAWKKTVVYSSGVVMNFVLAWFAFSVIFMVGTPKGVYISAVLENSPAAEAGLKSGDKLNDFDSITPLVDLIGKSTGSELALKVEREGKISEVRVIPTEGENGGRIGVELVESGFPRENFFKSLVSGAKSAGAFSLRIVNAFISMFRHGDFTGSTGPVGIFSAVQVAKDMGLPYFLQLLGVVSLNLMIVNIFPLPALDGGRLLFLLVEKIRKKPLNKKIISVVNSVSYALLLLLMFIVTIRDIIRLF